MDVMRKIIYFKIGSKDVHLPRLLGSFIIVIAALMFLHSVAIMYDSWSALKDFDDCIARVDSSDALLAQLQYMDCKDSLYNLTGAQIKGGSSILTSRMFWTAFLGPVATVLSWGLVFVFGMLLYNSANVIIPVEESIIEVDLKSIRRKKKTSHK